MQDEHGKHEANLRMPTNLRNEHQLQLPQYTDPKKCDWIGENSQFIILVTVLIICGLFGIGYFMFS